MLRYGTWVASLCNGSVGVLQPVSVSETVLCESAAHDRAGQHDVVYIAYGVSGGGCSLLVPFIKHL